MKKIKKEFDAVKFMREQRDKMSAELSKMTNKEILEYFKSRRKKNSVRPSA